MAAGDVTATISKPTGKALYFDGVNNSIDLPEITLGGDFTIAFWAKPQSGVNHQTITDDDDEAFNKGGTYIYNSSWKIRETIAGGGSSMGPTSFELNTWQFVTFTQYGTTAKAYYNGNLETTNDPFTPIAKANALCLGAGVSERGFIGSIADVRIYNRALSAEEIATLYTGKTIGVGLTGYWSLNDTTNPGKDDSGNNNNGTVNGAIEAAGHNTIEDDVKTARVSANDVWGFIPLANNQEIMMAHIEEA